MAQFLRASELNDLVANSAVRTELEVRKCCSAKFQFGCRSKTGLRNISFSAFRCRALSEKKCLKNVELGLGVVCYIVMVGTHKQESTPKLRRIL